MSIKRSWNHSVTLLLFGILFVAIFAIVVSVRKTRRSIATHGEQACDEWLHLKELLLSRHLIVSHLLDALPENPVTDTEWIELSKFNALAQASIQKLNPHTAKTSEFSQVAHDQEQCVAHLVRLIDSLQQSQSLPAQNAVTACLKGLEECEQKVDEAKAVFNTSVIAYQARLDSRFANLVSRTFGDTWAFREVNFGLHGSGSDVNQLNQRT